MSKYGTANDPNCYPGTSVLKNKLNIRDQETLDEAENAISAHAIRFIRHSPPPYTISTWKKIHKSLFFNLYAWAGKTRGVDISKEDTLFCTWTRIDPEGEKLFTKLSDEGWLAGLEIEEFVEKAAFYFIEFNILHPFREGNGRSQRLLFDSIFLNAGYVAHWDGVTKREWIEANKQGLTKTTAMELIFKRIVRRTPV